MKGLTLVTALMGGPEILSRAIISNVKKEKK